MEDEEGLQIVPKQPNSAAAASKRVVDEDDLVNNSNSKYAIEGADFADGQP